MLVSVITRSTYRNLTGAVVTVLQGALIAALVVLQHFAVTTAGANHYVYYNKLIYVRTILKPANLHIIGIVAVLLAVSGLIRLARGIGGDGAPLLPWGLLAGVALIVPCVVLVLAAFTPLFSGMLVWAYFLFIAIAVEVLALLETIPFAS